jgi:Na+-transporting NADH:ubiquinone oxidoreductase subunit C
MPRKKRIIYPVVFMFTITFLLTLSLATINELTYDRIKRIEDLEIKEKMLYAFDIKINDTEDPQEIFSKNIEEKVIGDSIIFLMKENGEIKSYGVTSVGPGLWGSISIFLVLDKNLDEVVGLNVLSHSETPGLGGRIDELWYKDQFRKVKLNPSGDYISYKPSSEGNVDSIAGATLTSESVKKIINQEIINIRQILEVE